MSTSLSRCTGLLRLGALASIVGMVAAAACIPAPMEPVGYTVGHPRADASASSSGASGSAPAVVNPAIAGTLAQISSELLRSDLVVLTAYPRHHDAPGGRLTAASRYIEQVLNQAELKPRRQTVSYEGHNADNLIAEVPGSDPDRVIIVSAHYDSVLPSPGADDDASGVAALLSIARASAKLHPKATIRFVFFCFEEQGLIGSQYYVRSLAAAERAKVVGVFNLEMIGYTDRRPGSQRYPVGVAELFDADKLPTSGDFIGVIGRTSDHDLIDVLERSKMYVPRLKTASIAVPTPALLVMPDLLRSDHAPFWLGGVSAVLIGDTADFRTPHYHQPTDSIETLDLQFATQVTRWVAASTLELAVLPGPK